MRPDVFRSLWLRLLPVVVLLVLAFGLRVYMLDDLNYNWDEGYSNWIANLPFGEMLETTAHDVHPPLYYIGLRAMQAIGGDSEFAARFGSVLLGVLSVALTYALGHEVGGYAVGVGAALLVTLARANIEISQLARMHILTTTLATGALWATVRVWEKPSSKWAKMAYIVCVAGSLYSFYLAVVLPLATNLAFLFVWWRKRFNHRFFLIWVGLQVVVVLLFAPWAIFAIERMHGWSSEGATSFRFFLQFYFVTLTTGIPIFWEQYMTPLKKGKPEQTLLE